MRKLYQIVDNGVIKGFYFDCPGCKMGHSLIAQPYEAENGACWKFNGNEEAPTFYPSILSRFARVDGSAIEICHLYVTDGELRFLRDCTHALAGQTVAMLDIVEKL